MPFIASAWMVFAGSVSISEQSSFHVSASARLKQPMVASHHGGSSWIVMQSPLRPLSTSNVAGIVATVPPSPLKPLAPCARR